MFFALPNLVSKSVSPCPTPWLFSSPIPDEVRGKQGKKARDTWISNPDTSHNVYCAFEGLNEGMRIGNGKKGEEDNPPLRLHALIGDYDCAVSQEELAAGFSRVRFLPNYYEKTLSGYARLIWLFEAPVTLPDRKFAVEFLELAKQRLRVEQIAPALDLPAWASPDRYYTNSCDWLHVQDTVLPTSLLTGWVLEVAEKHHWKKQKNAVAIPLPIVFAEIEKKYPNHGWPGDFVEESQGPSFWVPNSVSPKSAIVKPTGLFTFAASAPKSFYSWADLLGADFVKTHETEMLGQAVSDIYHDGKLYYRYDGYREWRPYSKEDIQSHLVTTRGLVSTKEGDAPSELSRAMEYIRDWHGVTGAAPFVFQQAGVVRKNGMRFLNTHTRKALAPVPAADTPKAWGDGFPFIAEFLRGFFEPKEQLDFFLAWLARFYRGAHNMDLCSGQNTFILGKPNVGKTFLSQGILPFLMGGSAEAEDYLLGKTDFNSELFEVALWTVDDNSATVDERTHRKFTSITKKMAANTTFQYHAKFRIPCSVDWLGRVLVTANDDEESARIVPDLNQSNIDKFNLFRAAPKSAVKFLSRREMTAIKHNETPHFARYLLDYTIPEHCEGEARFGVKAYHEATLLKAAEHASPTAGFLEIVEDWRETHFAENPTLEYWEGSAYQLLVRLNADQTRSAAGVRNLSVDRVGRGLATLRSKGFPFYPDGEGVTRNWRIYRPKPRKIAPLPVSTTPGGLA